VFYSPTGPSLNRDPRSKSLTVQLCTTATEAAGLPPKHARCPSGRRTVGVGVDPPTIVDMSDTLRCLFGSIHPIDCASHTLPFGIAVALD
jgi:hypothetical protein